MGPLLDINEWLAIVSRVRACVGAEREEGGGQKARGPGTRVKSKKKKKKRVFSVKCERVVLVSSLLFLRAVTTIETFICLVPTSHPLESHP